MQETVSTRRPLDMDAQVLNEVRDEMENLVDWVGGGWFRKLADGILGALNEFLKFILKLRQAD